VKSLPAVLLLLAAGCSGFETPTPAQLRALPLSGEESAPSGQPLTRIRFQLSIDSPWLAGEFEGVVLADRTPAGPRLRAQLFGDLGPKVADLTVRADRIVGYFPETHEGIDCALPREASPHPLLFMGASLGEELLDPETPGRVTGIREEAGGVWLRLRPFVPGTEVHRFAVAGNPAVKKRRFWWMIGVHWEEDWVSPTECRITAPNLAIRVKILGRESRDIPASQMDLSLPEDVRLVAGSRK
jgi:hypothetical protein